MILPTFTSEKSTTSTASPNRGFKVNVLAKTPNHEALPGSNFYRSAVTLVRFIAQNDLKYVTIISTTFSSKHKADIHNHLTAAIQ